MDLKLLAASRERLHIGEMAVSPSVIFSPKPLKVGVEWQVGAQYPSGQVEMITGFKTETEATEWIKKDSKAWLEKRGYADE